MVKDELRWKQNHDGSWSRRLGEDQAATPNATQGALAAAAEFGLDLASISGSGKDGKITKADVEAATNS